MKEDKEHILDSYFQAARSQELVVPFSEVRQNFIDSSPKPPPTENGSPNSNGSLPTNRFLQFFKLKINIVYAVISAALIGLLAVGYFVDKEEQVPAEEEEEVMVQPVVKAEEEVAAEDLPMEVTSTSSDSKEEQEVVLIDEVSSQNSMEIQTKSAPKQSQQLEDDPVEVSEEQVNRDGLIDNNENVGAEPVDQQEETAPKPKTQRQAKPTALKVKPPFTFTFTPETPEAELRKLQSDLKKEQVNLVFTKLKYKGNRIEKIEGTITLEGYEGRFTTDEFDDFTFKWSYSKYRGGLPEKFDIIINTPLQKKSNTEVHIDEITY
jgi:hypothetical protein